MSRIGFVGSGNMAEALIKGIINAGVYKPEQIYISDIQPGRLGELAETYNVVPSAGNSELARSVDVLVLSVKPQNMTDALRSVKDGLDKGALVISIAAGVKTDSIASELGEIAIIRVMPNTPAMIGEGAAVLFANAKGKSMLEQAKTIFSSAGIVAVVDDEDLLDAVTAVSGSGPAYYFLLTEELIKAAVYLGLPDDVARKLVLQTGKGAALLADEADKKGQTPAELRKKVTSPGGTTEAALSVFADGQFGQLVAAAVKKAWERSRQLSV